MIVMGLKLDNIYGFKDFSIDFSYPRKIKDSTIPSEYLEERPNFRFKKLGIIMGSNATGKTSLGRTFMDILNFLYNKNFSVLYEKFKPSTGISSFEIDLVFDNYNFYRIKCKIDEKYLRSFEILKTKIKKKDSYESAIENLEPIVVTTDSKKELRCCLAEEFEDEGSYVNADDFIEFLLKGDDKKQVDFFIFQYLEELKKEGLSWYFTFPDSQKEHLETNINILEKLLKTFDSSITKVKESKEEENTYIIFFKNNSTVRVTDGEITEKGKKMISSGTEQAISVSNALSEMLSEGTRPFYIDEKFSYVHSELESNMLNLMIACLQKNSQLFFTTHNSDILDMNFPKHSFYFLRKKEKIEVVTASELMKKSDRSLRIAVENDVFDTSPNLKYIDELLDDVL